MGATLKKILIPVTFALFVSRALFFFGASGRLDILHYIVTAE